MQVLAIPLLLVLGLAATVERRVHYTLFVARYGDPDTLARVGGAAAMRQRSRLDRGSPPVTVRVCGFLASDAGILAAIFLLAGTGIAGLFWIQ